MTVGAGLLGVLGAAWAATVEVVPAHDALHPSIPARVLVVVVDDEGHPVDRLPRVEVEGGSARYEASLGPGVWAFTVVPPDRGTEVRFDVSTLDAKVSRSVEMVPLSEGGLEVPRRVDATAGGGPVTFVVSGADLPPPDALQVAAGAGTLASTRVVPAGLEVTLEPGESPFPRYVPVGLLDGRRDTAPSWTGLRIHTRPRVALQTEPGTTLNLSVGGRDYGPFEADAEGVVSAVFDQYPGEMVAQAVLTDDLGNETTTSLPLSSHTQPSLVALPSGPLVPGRAPPVVWLRGFHGDGHPWEGSPPVCRTPTVGDLGVHAMGRGAWMLPLTELRTVEAVDVRVQCTLGGVAESVVRVPVAEGVAGRLRLRLWPEVLSRDFPVAEVQVVLEDVRGERLPVEGVTVTAERGTVTLDPVEGLTARGEYRGEKAVEAGGDVLRAAWSAPPGEGWPQRVEVGHGLVPAGGAIAAYGRALDAQGRPLPGVDLALSAGGDPVWATTGPDGWAAAEVPLPADRSAWVVSARGAFRAARAVALPGGAAVGGPGQPELTLDKAVEITAGRTADVYVSVDPGILYTGANAVAEVRVAVFDRSGNPVPNADVELTASEGTVGPVFPTPDGRYRAEYTPPPGERPREVILTARSESASSTTRLLLEPRPLERAIGLSFGATTNFGAVLSPLLSVDLDWRTPWFGGGLVVRFGVATYGDASTVETGFGDDARVRMVLVPVTLGLLGRRDFGGQALWLGLGGIVAPYRLDARVGDDPASRGVGVLPPGLGLIGGVGQRFGGGEVMLEIRGTALSSPGGALAYQGPVGGLGAVIGYRLIW